MPVARGTYIIHNIDTERALDYWYSYHRFACCKTLRHEAQHFYVRPVVDAIGYTMQNIRTKWYIRIDGNILRDSCDHDKVIWNFEHQFGDVYIISLLGSKSRIWYPNRAENKDQLVYMTERDSTEGCLWRFEKISDDTGGDELRAAPDLRPVPSPVFHPQINVGGPNTIVPKGSQSPYVDDAHFHTDMLFNMPRTPFTRTQRAAVLGWARKLGAANVPTMESFDECERALEAVESDMNNAGHHG